MLTLLSHTLLRVATPELEILPYTTIHYPLFTSHTIPMPAGVLKPARWAQLTKNLENAEVISTILSICQYGARIGYHGHRSTITIHQNLPTAEHDSKLVSADIVKKLHKNRLVTYPDMASLPTIFTASPLGLVDKSNGTKRRIHHLSYPPGDPSPINNGIPEEYGTIAYSNIHQAVQAVQHFGSGCTLVKCDFESAYCHVPVSPLDSPLLIFKWENRYYAERFLPFGLCTATCLFDLFAEVFHWILADKFKHQKLEAKIIHYLDDFIIVLPEGGNTALHAQTFTSLCFTVGLSIKESKNEEAKVATFGGLELNTQAMVIRLPEKKLLKAREIIRTTTVVLLRQSFLRRLYNMELYFPPGTRHAKLRLSREAQKDLDWLSEVLQNLPERSIAQKTREVVLAWSDATSTKGLGRYYLSRSQTSPLPESAFSISRPPHLTKTKEHINTEEMRAVEQVFLYWGGKWRGKRLVIHIDNSAVVHGLIKQTMRAAPVQVLRRCLLHAAAYDLNLEPRWVLTTDNALADALSRFDLKKIADLAPQLLPPTCNLQQCGFLIYDNLDYQQSLPTTYGAGLPHQQEGTMTHLDPASPPSAHCPTTTTTMGDASLLSQLG